MARTILMNFRVSKRERQAIETLARMDEVGISEIIRTLVRDEARKRGILSTNSNAAEQVEKQEKVIA